MGVLCGRVCFVMYWGNDCLVLLFMWRFIVGGLSWPWVGFMSCVCGRFMVSLL